MGSTFDDSPRVLVSSCPRVTARPGAWRTRTTSDQAFSVALVISGGQAGYTENEDSWFNCVILLVVYGSLR